VSERKRAQTINRRIVTIKYNKTDEDQRRETAGAHVDP